MLYQVYYTILIYTKFKRKIYVLILFFFSNFMRSYNLNEKTWDEKLGEYISYFVFHWQSLLSRNGTWNLETFWNSKYFMLCEV